MNTFDTIIVGAGFVGIYTAWRLAQSGQRVALVEANDRIGGNLNSKYWNSFWLDNGTHNFDARTQLGEIFYKDVLGEQVIHLDNQTWASVSDKVWSYGFEFPDLSFDYPEICTVALEELELIRINKGISHENASYLDMYRSNYGTALTTKMRPIIKKYTGSDPSEFAIEANSALDVFMRPKLGSDPHMLELKKQDEFWDHRLGVSLSCGDNNFIGKNQNKRFMYPPHNGLRGFCDLALRRLNELGVTILLSSPVISVNEVTGSAISVMAGEHNLTGQKVFWSLPENTLINTLNLKTNIAQHLIPVGSLFFAFEVHKDAILGPDYLHDFSTRRLAFRYNKQGIYSQQTKRCGNSFVVAEVPCHPKNISDLLKSENSERIWLEMQEVGFIRSQTSATSSTFWSLPLAYTIPKIGWKESSERLHHEIRNHTKMLEGVEFGFRGKLKFMEYYEKKLQQKLVA